MKTIKVAQVVKNNIEWKYGNKGPISKWFDPNWEGEWMHNFIEREVLAGLTPKDCDQQVLDIIQEAIFKEIDNEISFAERNIPNADKWPTTTAFYYFKETFGRKVTKARKELWHAKIHQLLTLLRKNK